jgi:hypothetical protein
MIGEDDETPAAVYKDEEEIVDKSWTMGEKQNIYQKMTARRKKQVSLRPLNLAKYSIPSLKRRIGLTEWLWSPPSFTLAKHSDVCGAGRNCHTKRKYWTILETPFK